ncbi:MAG: DUF1439 domain-containing protein [Gammaproteobacteria bacterium]
MKHTNKHLPGKGAYALMILAMLSQVACGFSRTLEISERELQEKITEKMPLVKEKKYVSLTLTDAVIDLLPNDNRIGLSSNLRVDIPGGTSRTGKAKVIGSLKYKPKKGAFYLDKPEIVSFQLDQMPENKQTLIQNIAQIILTRVLSKTPIYKLKDKNLTQLLIKATLESVVVEEERILVKFSAL